MKDSIKILLGLVKSGYLTSDEFITILEDIIGYKFKESKSISSTMGIDTFQYFLQK